MQERIVLSCLPKIPGSWSFRKVARSSVKGCLHPWALPCLPHSGNQITRDGSEALEVALPSHCHLWPFENTVSLLCLETPHRHTMPCVPIANAMKHAPCGGSSCRTKCLCWMFLLPVLLLHALFSALLTWINPTFLIALNQASSLSRKSSSLF